MQTTFSHRKGEVMVNCYLAIAGLNIKINTDEELLITDKFRPFLHELEIEQPDCVINMKCCDKLPEKLSEEYRKGLTGFTGNLYRFRNFHYEVNEEITFGATCMEEKSKLYQWYLPAYKKYFQDSAAVFKYIGLESILMCHERILLHASFIRYKDCGILFSAPSGTGKSTQAELWRKSTGAEVINGDRAALSCENERWIAWGIPYAGTSGICKNEQVPLGAIVILRQGTKNRVEKLNCLSALKYLYPETSMHPWDYDYVDRAMNLLQNLVENVPVYLLECLPEESAVKVLQRTLEEEGILK